MPLNFLSAIYKGEITLNEPEFFQNNLEKKTEELRIDYIPKMQKKKKK